MFEVMFGELMNDPFGRVFMLVYGIFFLIILAYSFVVYVLQSLGLYGISKRRGIHNPWLAWLPIGNVWIIGSISDQYQYLVKGRNRNRRKVLLGLYIALYVLLIIFYLIYFSLMGKMVMGIETEYLSPDIALPFMGIFLISIPMFAVSVAALVFLYIAYYDLFASCQPENAVLFLVLSVVFNVTIPFFVFAMRNKDAGMPPRRQEANTML